MAVTTEIWYVDDDRVVVNFSTAVVNGVATKRILRAKGVLNTDGTSPAVGDLSYTLFANSGAAVSASQLAQAQAEKSNKSLPAASVNPGGGGGGGAGVDTTARSSAASALSAAQAAAQAAADAATAASTAASTAGTAQTTADAAVTKTSALLRVQAADPDSMIVGGVTRDSNGTTSSFNVLWPDGATGVFAGTPSLTKPGYVDSYTITHILGGVTQTYTQPTIVRDPQTGVISSRPAVVVSNGAPVTPVIPTATTITATAGTAGSGQIVVSSTGGSGITTRAVYRSTTASVIANGTVVATTVPYTDTATPNVTYYYQEVVTSSTGHTAASNITSASVAPVPVIPTADTITVTAGADGSGQATIDGTGRTNTDSLSIYRGVSSPVSTSNTPVAASLPFTDNDLTGGVTYYYVEVVTSVTGDTTTSNTVSVTVAAAPAPTAAPTVTLGTATVNTQPLTYTTVTNATAYEISHKLASGSTWTVDTATATGTTYTVTNLAPNTSYDYRVRASNATGPGPYSTTATGSTAADTTAPTPPTTVVASAGNTQVTLTFSGATDNVGVTGYKVYDAATAGNLVTTGASSPIIITGLTNNTSYTFYVTALDAAGNESTRAAANSATPANETVFFSDDFTRADTTGGGTVGNGWVDPSNAFQVKTNSVAPTISGTTASARWLVQSTPAPAGSLLRVRFNNKVTGTYGASNTLSIFSIAFALPDAGTTTTDRYNFGYIPSTGAWTIEKRITGQTTVVLASGTASVTTPPFTWQVGFKTSTVLAQWINGVEIGSGTDSTPLTGRYFGLYIFGSLASPSTVNSMRADDFVAVTA